MKRETFAALSLIFIGGLAAVILTLLIWQSARPTQLTADVVHSSPSSMTRTSPSVQPPALPYQEPEQSESGRNPLAAIDTADPFLPPNAHIPQTTQARQFPPSPRQQPVPNQSTATPTSKPLTPEPSTKQGDTSQSSFPETTPESSDPTTPTSVDPEPTIPTSVNPPVNPEPTSPAATNSTNPTTFLPPEEGQLNTPQFNASEPALTR